ncbi:triple gene block protein 1 [Phaius virus X]|uniref:Triple gene block protein 1 n=1 Tax=Phaius virus X TaxID=457382 RepID=B0I2Z3_9VIRU|nr:triple gene block protein 1 [Phaius virus X]BAG06155.1 triple gene block protein 1 [Phaius virus X]
MELYTGELQQKFHRTNVPLKFPIVLHTVAGAGKTTFVRQLINKYSHLTACTFGTPDPPNLLGRYITAPCPFPDVVDEYPLCEEYSGVKLLVADPLQHRRGVLPAHYTGTHTFRFGKSTCDLLKTLGVVATSDKEDIVSRHPAFNFDPEGLIIALGPEAVELLEAHSLPFLRPCQALGLTTSVVTLLTDKPLDEQDPVDAYISITRHTDKLNILS